MLSSWHANLSSPTLCLSASSAKGTVGAGGGSEGCVCVERTGMANLDYAFTTTSTSSADLQLAVAVVMCPERDRQRQREGQRQGETDREVNKHFQNFSSANPFTNQIY